MHIYAYIFTSLPASCTKTKPSVRVEYASAKDCLRFSPLKCKCIRAQMKSCEKQHVNYSHFEGRGRQKQRDDTFMCMCAGPVGCTSIQRLCN